jgi:hypothetical protein
VSSGFRKGEPMSPRLLKSKSKPTKPITGYVEKAQQFYQAKLIKTSLPFPCPLCSPNPPCCSPKSVLIHVSSTHSLALLTLPKFLTFCRTVSLSCTNLRCSSSSPPLTFPSIKSGQSSVGESGNSLIRVMIWQMISDGALGQEWTGAE